jgi:hypothetical protein
MTGTGIVGTTTQNPTTNQVMVTVTLPASGSNASPPSANYLVNLKWYSSVAATYLYQVLNASNSVLATITLPAPANNRSAYDTNQISFKIPDGYTLQIICASSFTGFGQAEIYYAIETLN